MPKASRLNDIGSDHACFPPSNVIAGSGNVFINGLPAARVSDPLMAHGCGKCTPHARNIAIGSSSVFINSLAAARIGDAINCGGSMSTGSPDVNIGG